METILSLRNITKRFGSLVANDGISLDVARGSVHAVIGENGAGKSTLMNVISGIYQPDGGKIQLNGRTVHFSNPNNASKQGVGMVHQEFMLYPELKVLDNIIMGYERRQLIGIDYKKSAEQVREICALYQFNIPLDEKVSELPISMLQQVEIVKILYRGAEIVIFDEPTSVLTPQGIEGLFNAIRFLVQQGKTILFITHKLKEVLSISDTVSVLKNGRLIGTLPTAEATEPGLASMMVGRDVILTTTKPEKQLGDVVLEVENLCVRDSENQRKVKNVSFSIRKGEILGVAGVAGSGQRELVSALFGLVKPESGTIRYLGQDITQSSCRSHRQLGIGYVPQDRMRDGVNWMAPIYENCIMGYHIAHGFGNPVFIRKKQALAFSQQVIEQFQVKAPSANAPIGTLSGGNIQKVIVGREFLQDNQLLIIEDPTRGIDVGAIEFVWQKIESLAAAGVAVLLVSHELFEVMEVSDRLLVLYEGTARDGGLRGELNEMEIGLLMAGGDVRAGA